ncbi:hypothetical protein G7085_18560 [Tessaracoccus sp. HDW20]|uniref:hypothetical protein n=1 Tax=Tessaracoccus coleopterorum TaxID=2714950 RepID=UPI0018D34910|nr:hypothetical protein [Tessaracoccus coleopterorum]NHB85877.1 hypothetical protein [Tessaracoccus coleopterorum]
MQEHAFVERTGAGLRTAAAVAASMGVVEGPVTGASLTATNLRLCAGKLLEAAIARTGSAGCHRRLDHQEDIGSGRTAA